MLDELNAMEPMPFFLPLSTDARLSRFMKTLIENPGDKRSFDVLARKAGSNLHTLSRLFASETGMTFSQWRMRLRMMEAVERLSQGRTITQVSFELGYASASAFIAAFRRNLGVTPGQNSMPEISKTADAVRLV